MVSSGSRERDCPVILCPFECIDCLLGGDATGLTVRKVGSGRLENRTWEKGEKTQNGRETERQERQFIILGECDLKCCWREGQKRED